VATQTRDQILIQALDMLDNPELDKHDRPAGTIATGAFSTNWLQRGVDKFLEEFPWQSSILTTTAVLDSTGVVVMPADFLKVLRDGVLIPSEGFRVRERGWQEYLDARAANYPPGPPQIYVMRGTAMFLYPRPASSKPFDAEIWYHRRPGVLAASTVSEFPSDSLLIDFVRLRGLEWLRLLPPGSAEKWANDRITELRVSGLAGEPENQSLPLDPSRFRPSVNARPWDWMGRTSL